MKNIYFNDNWIPVNAIQRNAEMVMNITIKKLIQNIKITPPGKYTSRKTAITAYFDWREPDGEYAKYHHVDLAKLVKEFIHDHDCIADREAYDLLVAEFELMARKLRKAKP